MLDGFFLFFFSFKRIRRRRENRNRRDTATRRRGVDCCSCTMHTDISATRNERWRWLPACARHLSRRTPERQGATAHTQKEEEEEGIQAEWWGKRKGERCWGGDKEPSRHLSNAAWENIDRDGGGGGGGICSATHEGGAGSTTSLALHSRLLRFHNVYTSQETKYKRKKLEEDVWLPISRYVFAQCVF